MPKNVDTGLMRLSVELDRLCDLSEQVRANLGEMSSTLVDRACELDSDFVGDVRDELTRLCGALMWQINILLVAEEQARSVANVG